MPREITPDLDARRRVSLWSLVEKDVTHLVACRCDDGSVVLEPATVVTRLEPRFHRSNRQRQLRDPPCFAVPVATSEGDWISCCDAR